MMLIVVKHFFLNNFLYCCAGWGYIVAFTKVLKIYQIYHIWIHPLHYSPLPSPPAIPGIVQTGIIFPFIYMCTQYLKHIQPPTPFPHRPTPTGTNTPRQDLFCSPSLWFYTRIYDIFVCLRELYWEFPRDISRYICIITWIG
jgi:hypothetical protein